MKNQSFYWENFSRYPSIAEPDILEKLEALLPWNVDLERASKKVPRFD